MPKIQKLVQTAIQKIESMSISPQVWIFSLFCIIAFRVFLENLSNTTKGFFNFAIFSSFFLHYPLYYFTGLLSFILLSYFLSERPNRNIIRISKILCFGMIFIWLGPIFDLILTGSKGDLMKYMKFNPSNPFDTLFFMFTKPLGISNGIRVEITAILTVSTLYFYYSNRKILKTFIYLILGYFIIFLLLIAPSVIIMLSNYQKTGVLSQITNMQISNFTDVTSFKNMLSELSQTSYILTKRDINTTAFNMFASWIYLIMALIVLNVWFNYFSNRKFIYFWKNARWERIIYYLSLILIGFILASRLNIYYWKPTLFNLINLIILFISIISSWLLQVNINDIEDRKIDAISNTNRPLINNSLTVKDFKIYNFFLILIIIFSSATLSYEIFSLLVAWNCVYFIYSSPPFRLKQFPIISSLAIGINGAITILIGFMFASGGYYYNKIPNTLMLTFVLIISLISMVKDIKDIKGDKADGILTIPVIYGEKLGKIIISLCVILALILTSLLPGPSILQMTSIPFGIASTYLINKKNFKEIYLFILFYIYILVLFIFNNLQTIIK